MQPIQMPDTYDPALQAQLDAIAEQAMKAGIQTYRRPDWHNSVVLVIRPLINNDGYETSSMWAVEDYTGRITARVMLDDTYNPTDGTLANILKIIEAQERNVRRRLWLDYPQYHLAPNGFPTYHLGSN